MILDYNFFKNTLNKYLLDQNTTTATIDLSQDLKKRIVQVSSVDIDQKGDKSSRFPAIFTMLSDKSEEIAYISNNNVDRYVTLGVRCTFVYNDNSDHARWNLNTMIRNFEGIIRNNISLNDYRGDPDLPVQYCQLMYMIPTTVNFKNSEGYDSHVNQSADLNLLCKFQVTV
jgi:hypothetical protein